jgi:hypothetical protein
MLRSLLTSVFVLLILTPIFAAEPSAKRPIRLAKDGFPTGSEAPEGAACDLMRAFIRNDTSLLLRTCIKPFGGVETKTSYQKDLDSFATYLKEEAKSNPSRGHAAAISKCFAARHLSKNDAASYGAATFGFKDIMFVDVEDERVDGKTQTERILVIKDKDSKWGVYLHPDLNPLLSTGLNEEGASEEDFSINYLTK